MSDAPPEPPEPVPPTANSAPSPLRKLWTLAKVSLGVVLVLFGCRLIWVWAFGPDESLLYAYRVKAQTAKDQTEFWKKYSKRLRAMHESGVVPAHATPLERNELEQLERDLELAKRDWDENEKKGYRVQRFWELGPILGCFVFAPALMGSGRGVLWGKRPQLR